ncbi:pyridine nucleotide-disulfide oxidoreductase domain-containing protein 2-like [Neocloeon triangulifer]|uniref:pyridine nucleotide-disulfide oxidoreductase domain-containing protein 2-like n=1 Tax=Neocloeon triangulifer TaxID=2078957 RepID=UPI00286F70E2|nr:pyridine nucleotide-disulfide oxidoreductase domain-containing protein 2-like [Neocloeon triangulifer]
MFKFRPRGFSSLRADLKLITRKKSYDAIVIGGGHNGLVSACYLQMSGAKVCVLERRPVVGGAAVTEEIVPGFKFSRASYVLSLLRPQIIKDLELKKHGLKVHLRNPSSYTPLHEALWSKYPAKSLTLSSSEEFNQKQISQFSKKDAEAYPKYEKYLEKMVQAVEPLLDLPASSVKRLLEDDQSLLRRAWSFYKDKRLVRASKALSSLSGSDLNKFLELMTAPATKILDRWFESEPLKATLATDAVIGAFTSPHDAGTSYVLLHHVMGELEGVKGAWGYPEGGMGAVTQAMASKAKSLGVDIFTNMEVKEILWDSKKGAQGVATAKGEEIKSRLVLSNATPEITYLKLLPKEALSAEFRAAAQSIDYKSPVTKINVAVKELPNFLADPTRDQGMAGPHHQTTIHLNCESVDLLEQAYSDARDGLISRRPMLEMVIPSSLDKTIAPPGCHVCLIFSQYTPYHLRDGKVWDENTKNSYAKQVFHNIDEYAPGFSSSVIGYEVLSPPDLEQIFGLTGGNIFHGALSLDQLFTLRAGGGSGPSPPDTPVKNLLLCGSGGHPGGGVMGSPGKLAAEEAIKLLMTNYSKGTHFR